MKYNVCVGGDFGARKKWGMMTSTEQTILIHRTAKTNRLFRQKHPELAAELPQPAPKPGAALRPAAPQPEPRKEAAAPAPATPFYPHGYSPGQIHVPRFMRPACEVAAPFKRNKKPSAYYLQRNKKKFEENTLKRNRGEVYGLTMPFTPDELFSERGDYGCKWLTRAFHAAGSLPLDNRVEAFRFTTRFHGGHGGIKGMFQVKYAREDESLDELLFIKMPYPVSENSLVRYRDEAMGFNGDKFGGEWLFYRYLAPHLPFPVPKLYFGDVNRESTQAVCIIAAVPWPPSDDHRSHEDFGPWECFPQCIKCEDYKLSDPAEYYFPIFKLMGTFAGMAKAGRLGPEQGELPWYDCTAQTDPCTAASTPDVVETLAHFILNVAPHWYPDEAKGAWLGRFAEKSRRVLEHQRQLGEFLYSDPRYMGLHHENANIDNAFYFRRDDGSLDCGMFDWAATCHLSYATGIMGCTVACLWETLAEYQEDLMKCWFDAYHAAGAPRLEWRRLMLHYRVATLIGAYGIFSMTRGQVDAGIYRQCESWRDDRVNEFFGSKYMHGMIYNRVMLMINMGDYFWNALEEIL